MHIATDPQLRPPHIQLLLPSPTPHTCDPPPQSPKGAGRTATHTHICGLDTYTNMHISTRRHNHITYTQGDIALVLHYPFLCGCPFPVECGLRCGCPVAVSVAFLRWRPGSRACPVARCSPYPTLTLIVDVRKSTSMNLSRNISPVDPRASRSC